MILKKGKSEVTFVYKPLDSCQRVELGGTFNEWQPHQSKMARQKDGTFRRRLKLKPGEYHYKFLVDERNFSKERIENSMKKLISAKKEKQQTSLADF